MLATEKNKTMSKDKIVDIKFHKIRNYINPECITAEGKKWFDEMGYSDGVPIGKQEAQLIEVESRRHLINIEYIDGENTGESEYAQGGIVSRFKNWLNEPI